MMIILVYKYLALFFKINFKMELLDQRVYNFKASDLHYQTVFQKNHTSFYRYQQYERSYVFEAYELP